MKSYTTFPLPVTRVLYVITSVLLLFMMASCGNGLSGETYIEENGKDGIEFKSDKAYVTLMGSTIEAAYSIDDDKIKVEARGQTFILTKHDDGTITGLPMAGTLKKKE